MTTTSFFAKKQKWLGLVAIIPAIAMIFTDQAVLPVSLPAIQKQLGASAVELWWCVNAYLLTSAIFLLVGGKLGDHIGYKKIFLFGMAFFAFSSALCGLSTTPMYLIGSRVLQGLGAATMIPASSPLLMALFPQNERGKANGINVSVGSIFLILAPIIGGLFTEYLSWRWIFWVNLPIAAIGLLMGGYFIPVVHVTPKKFDFLGAVFFMISCSALVALIMQSPEWGWFSLKSLGLFVFFVVFGVLLLWREKCAKHPFIDLSLFKHSIFKAVNITVFFIQFIIMITVYRAVFFQDAFHWTAVKSGLAIFCSSLPVLFMSPIAGWIADRYNPKLPIAIGFSLLIYSFAWSAFFVDGSLTMILLGFFAFGFGVPLIFTPSYSAAMGSIPPTKAGVAFGIIATLRAIGGSLGIAILSSASIFLERHLFVRSETPDIEAYFTIHIAFAAILILAFAFVFTLHHRHRKGSHHSSCSIAEGWDS